MLPLALILSFDPNDVLKSSYKTRVTNIDKFISTHILYYNSPLLLCKM